MSRVLAHWDICRGMQSDKKWWCCVPGSLSSHCHHCHPVLALQKCQNIVPLLFQGNSCQSTARSSINSPAVLVIFQFFTFRFFLVLKKYICPKPCFETAREWYLCVGSSKPQSVYLIFFLTISLCYKPNEHYTWFDGVSNPISFEGAYVLIGRLCAAALVGCLSPCKKK